MDCTENRKRLHAYIDHELDPATASAVDLHRSACPSCNAMFLEQSALQSAVRRHAEYHRAPSALAERIRAELGTAEARFVARRPEGPWRHLPRLFQLGFATAAGAAAAWILAVRLAIPGATDALAEQVITGHARAVLTSRLVDIETSERHTVKPWLSSKLDFSPPVKDLAAQGFRLVGGRLDYVDNRPVAALVYHRRAHVIDLFVWPDATSGGDLPLRGLSRHGYNVLHWTKGGMAFWTISDVDAAELETFAKAYASAR